MCFVCHHLPHKDVHFAAKRGGFTAIFSRHKLSVSDYLLMYSCDLFAYS